MSTTNKRRNIIAIAVADLHLSWRPPIARQLESDWLGKQREALRELFNMAAEYKCPIIIAGDIFDRWNAPVGLVNFFIDCLALYKDTVSIFAIPGQHDLPTHRMEEKHRSAYWNLMQQEKINDLSEINSAKFLSSDICIRGFGWGQLLGPPRKHESEMTTRIAVLHQYVWVDGASYPTASDDQKINAKFITQCDGWDLVITGDNHKSFLYDTGEGSIIYNAGGFQRRHVDERNRQPQVGIIKRDENNVITVEPHVLKTSENDKVSNTHMKHAITDISNMQEFIAELESIEKTSLDFREAIKQYIEQHEDDPLVIQYISEAIGD
jgi:DNA repair exonuclease SbcCD nuclease subunit